MSADQYRRDLEGKRKQRVDAEMKAGSARSKESQKRTEASKARLAASKTSSSTTAQSKLREAERREKEAETVGREANQLQTKASNYQKEESSIQGRLATAERSEAQAAEQKGKREQQQAERRLASDRVALEARLSNTEMSLSRVFRPTPEPKPEKLRVLILGASSEGELRIGREQKRIRVAVESALHRDQIELDVRPAATTEDLLDGITKFRPHVVHFSGHSNDDLIVFEDEKDAPHKGVVVTARAFANAVQATDTPPQLVLLNSCNSASQIDALVNVVTPFAIGMADSIEDADAINYAARFYASIANCQSINAAHLAGRSALELAGPDGATLPTLAVADEADATTAVLVQPPIESN